MEKEVTDRICRVCGCTEMNCRQCIEKTGFACRWVEEDLCSACVESEIEEIQIETGEILEVYILTKQGSNVKCLCTSIMELQDTLEVELGNAEMGAVFSIEVAERSEEEINKAHKEENQFEGF